MWNFESAVPGVYAMTLTFPEKFKNSIHFAHVATLCSAVLSLMFVGCSGERQSVSAAPEVVTNVSVVSAQTASIPDVVEAVGTLRAAETSQLAAQMMGNIVEIRVREGDRVQRGQVLAVIEGGFVGSRGQNFAIIAEYVRDLCESAGIKVELQQN